MALPSQSARPIARRTHMHRRSRHRAFPRLFVFAAVVLAIALIVGWRIWPRPDGDEATKADRPGAAAVAKQDTATPAPQPKETKRSPRREPKPEPKSEPKRTASRSTPAISSKPPTKKKDPAPDTNEEPRGATVEMGRPVSVPDTTRDSRRVQTPPLLSRPTRIDTPADKPAAAPKKAPTTLAAPATTDAGTSRSARRQLDQGLGMLDRGDVINGRAELSSLLATERLGPKDASRVRTRLTELNERLIFSPEIHPRDPFVLEYVISSGDRLSTMPRKLGVQTDWRFVQRINHIPSPTRIRSGDRIKLVKGPFHAVIYKTEYRLDLYMGEDGDRVYVRSFDVGLGEYDRTPTGRFRVRPGSKLINPQWVNPRTRELFKPDDPMNPIGEHWLGLEGLDEHNKELEGYGIHGTIEPDSIGKQASMGCVRMLEDDVAIVWEVMVERVSTAEVRE